MKRFHVHVHVANLAQSVAFYSRLFGAAPVRHEADYAKWMLDDPRINFAISARGGALGVDHLGFQTDDPAELGAMRAQAQAADMALLDEGETTCCYARSDKYWLTDPQGVAWEQFHTLDNIPVFREAAPAEGAAACCAPSSAPSSANQAAQTAEPASAAACCAPRGKPVGVAVKSSSCC